MTEKVPSVAVLLNVYKRGEVFARQVAAVREQTIKPQEIYVWQNGDYENIPEHLKNDVTFANCNRNLGVWARLAFALNIEAEYICMLDDDTIPGSRWLENCLETATTHEGLLGTRGLKFRSNRSYLLAEDVGWRNPNNQTERVDIVGHSWFFRKEWLHAFWSEPSCPEIDRLVGEDIHFSFALQKVLGLNTYVPPHPLDNYELWGSQPEEGLLLGSSEVGVSLQLDANERFQKVYRAYIERGFRLSGEGNRGEDALAWGVSIASHTKVRNIVNQIPLLLRLKKNLKSRLFKS